MQTELKELMSAQPFVPFTVTMTDGRQFTIKHPEMALVTKLFFYVTTDGGETTNHLYQLHITRVERQEQIA